MMIFSCLIISGLKFAKLGFVSENSRLIKKKFPLWMNGIGLLKKITADAMIVKS
jgi:hypothetical protein